VSAASTVVGFGSTASNTPRGAAFSYASGKQSLDKVSDAGAPNLSLATNAVSVDVANVFFAVCYGTAASTGFGPMAPPSPAPIAVGPMTIDRVSLLCRGRQTPDSFSATALGCALIFNRALNSSELNGLRSALRARWGIPA
jgi:hypothetical protein